MKVICAWCGTLKKETPENPELVSHGICKACKEKEMPETKPGGARRRTTSPEAAHSPGGGAVQPREVNPAP